MIELIALKTGGSIRKVCAVLGERPAAASITLRHRPRPSPPTPASATSWRLSSGTPGDATVTAGSLRISPTAG